MRPGDTLNNLKNINAILGELVGRNSAEAEQLDRVQAMLSQEIRTLVRLRKVRLRSKKTGRTVPDQAVHEATRHLTAKHSKRLEKLEQKLSNQLKKRLEALPTHRVFMVPFDRQRDLDRFALALEALREEEDRGFSEAE